MFLFSFGRCIFKIGLRWVTKTYKQTLELFNRDNYVRQAARQMGDTKLLAKFSEGDIIAREGWYQDKIQE